VAKLDARYLECPVRCEKGDKLYDVTRDRHCDRCPVLKRRQTTRRQMEEALAEVLGEDHGFKTGDLERAVAQLRRLRPLGERILYKNHIALGVVREEMKD
jgi:hypothetical protein